MQRIRDLSNEEDSDFVEEESDESYVRSLYEFMQGTHGPTIVLDSHKNIAHMNASAEDITGIRESSSQGASLLDVCREQGLAATIIELCDDSANNMGSSQQGEYDMQGIPHSIHVVCLIGKDGFAKSFYVTFLRMD